jgi:bifunctional non-homologous end joining protein LigD
MKTASASMSGARAPSRRGGRTVLLDAPKKPMPVWIEPMKATLTRTRFSDDGWLFEPKLDGVRCLAFIQNRKVKLVSRRQLPMNDTYPEIVEALKKQPAKTLILDGEIVAFRPNTAITSFEVLQQRLGIHDTAEARRSPVRVYFYLFDLLYAEGRDLRDLPLEQRKAVLEALVKFGPVIRFGSHRVGQGQTYYEEACRSGWEGLIAKRRDSHYHAGRSSDWLKFKCIQEQEFVIGGYSEPEGARDHFGALLLGYYDQGQLLYAGKVGTGFNSRTLGHLMDAFKKLEQPASPFKHVDIPRRGLHWVKPVLVAQIGFAEWTKEGKLRQGRFVGLRGDKAPEEVTREKPISLGGPHGTKKSRS